MNTFTLTGTLKDINNNAIYAGRYVKFRVTGAGTDTDTSTVYPRQTFSFVVQSDGTLAPENSGDTMELWVNGDSGVRSYYRIYLPWREVVDVVLPSAVDGTTVDLSTIIESYQVDGSTQQNTTLGDAKAYTDVLADDPTNNTSFDAGNWQDAILPTPTNESILRGDGTDWVGATEFRVNTGTSNSGVEVGSGATANGDGSVAIGKDSVASGDNSFAFGAQVGGAAAGATASGDYSFAFGTDAVAGGSLSFALGSLAETDPTASLSVALGYRAKANHTGSFVFADFTVADVESTATDQFTCRFSGGYEFKGGDANFESGLSFSGGQVVDTIETTLTDDDTHIPTSGAVVDYVSGFKKATTSVTSTTYTVLSTDSVVLVDDDTAAAEVTVTLLAAATAGDGFLLNIKKTGSTANVVIDGNGAETIDGATTATLTSQYESITLVCDGSNWHII